MTVTLSSAGGSSVPNWTLLQTATPSGVTLVTFSGLSGYAKYQILAPILSGVSSGAYCQLRINGDSAANYQSNLANSGAGITQLNLGANSGVTTASVYVEISNCLLLAPKLISALSNVTPYSFVYQGYSTTSTVSSLTILIALGNFSAGSIYLLGAN